ncbi:MerR family DNA-binding transcriptional regulator [Cryobacterium sp. 1639]|uniref:MerR family transcriptional regulator n=1 Tax=Cryobacterium inferilacus TaxID=2866629 RepID=UPI001C737E26|nr:MerR family transcriptional regulator [Cryobacterium sp. 1639]MBX0301124.1 MerR family DNA-binding transcriptional regulator [Cryobacterium sp. 1639]
MAWSTRELAELAGTTLKAVRHYHQIGLLDEPGRTSNGYKQYQVAHLVRLLQITRLANLGVPLAQIAQMGLPTRIRRRRCARWTPYWRPPWTGCSASVVSWRASWPTVRRPRCRPVSVRWRTS